MRIAIVAVLLTVAVCPVGAQDERDTSAARALFLDGVRLSDAGEWELARNRFERALAVHRSARIAFNLATACVHVGRIVEAVELFEEVRRDERAPNDARAASVGQLELLRPRLGRLLIHVEGLVAGVTLRLDGHVLPTAVVDVAMPADPGAHIVEAVRQGISVARAEVEVTAGSSRDVTLRVPVAATVPTPREVASRASAASAPTHDSRDETSGGNAGLWIGLALGAVVVAAVTIVVIVVVSNGSSTPDWDGDTSPGTLRW